MKPRIDISAQNNFTIWESGKWNRASAVGRSTLIAGPDGEKLQVIFDRCSEEDPMKPRNSNFHFLFFANLGQVVATAFIRKATATEQFYYELDLSRITALRTEPVQGISVARASMENLFSLTEMGAAAFEPMLRRAYNNSQTGYKEAYYDLIIQAVRKAMTPSADQTLFWGIPRVTDKEF